MNRNLTFIIPSFIVMLRNSAVTGFSFLLLFFSIPAESQNAESVASQYIAQYKKHISDASLLKKLNQHPSADIIPAFMPYTADSLPEVRTTARHQIAMAGLRSDKEKTRQKAISVILSGLDDKDAGAVANSINLLSEFKPSDFTPEHRYIVSQKVKTGTFHTDKLILLTGYIHIPDLIYNYRLMLNEKQYSARIKMNIHLALARMNDTTSVNYLSEKLKNIKVNDDAVYEIFPLLAYTRQKVMFDFLLENILTEEKKCLSANPDNEVPVICAYRIIELVAPYIHNFPAKTADGELISNDYTKTLREVKEWIKVHKPDYTLNYDVY